MLNAWQLANTKHFKDYKEMFNIFGLNNPPAQV